MLLENHHAKGASLLMMDGIHQHRWSCTGLPGHPSQDADLPVDGDLGLPLSPVAEALLAIL